MSDMENFDSLGSAPAFGPETFSVYSKRRLREVFAEALVRGIQGGAGAAEIPDDPEAPLPDSDVEVSGETIESNEIHEQAKGYLGVEGEDEETPSDEDPEKAADKRVAARKAAKAKAEAEESGETPDEDEAALEAKAAKQRGRKSNEHKALEAKAASYEKRFEQFENYVAQIQNQSQVQIRQMEQARRESEKALAVATKELEIIRARAEQQEEAGLSDIEKFERQVLRKAEGNLGKKYETKLQEMERRLGEEHQARIAEQRERDLQARIAGYDRDTDQVVAELLKGRAPEKVSALAPRTKTAVLNYAAAHNILPREAAKELRQWAHDFVLSGMRAKNVANKEKVAKGKAIPAANPAGKTQARGQTRPSQAAARKKGYGNALEQMVNENPPPWAN